MKDRCLELMNAYLEASGNPRLKELEKKQEAWLLDLAPCPTNEEWAEYYELDGKALEALKALQALFEFSEGKVV